MPSSSDMPSPSRHSRTSRHRRHSSSSPSSMDFREKSSHGHPTWRSASTDEMGDRRSGRSREMNNTTPQSEHRNRRHRDEKPELSSPSKRRRRSESSRSRSPYQESRKSHRKDRSRSPHPSGRGRRRHDDDYAVLSRSRSRSAQRDRRRNNSRSRDRTSRPEHKRRRSPGKSRSRSAGRRSRKALPSQDAAFSGDLNPESGAVVKAIEKQKANFGNTGLLAKAANTVAGTKIVLKYSEPPEARKPPASQQWQIFVFKGEQIVEEVPLYTRSCWLIGRESAVVDLQIDHPSSSKQHAVIQFRHAVKINEFGDKTNVVRPYIIDLGSANGTRLNGEKIKDSRYYEIRDKDLVKIGLSEREYVFMLPT